MTLKPKPIATIGSTERVNLPTLGFYNVPAKIDTGADSSSIWVTDIKEGKNDRLSFVVFGPGSRFYTGERVTVKKFKRTFIKNSFGVSEDRYKAQLVLQIGDRKILAWFTLADRAGMRYPMLIGRKLLKNKFVVDVGKKHVHTTTDKRRQVLVLGAPEHKVKEYFDLVASKTKHDTVFVCRSLKQLAFWIEAGNVRVYETATNRDISEFDLVYFKTHRRNYEFAVAAAEYLNFHHVRFVDDELRNHVAYDKLAETMRLALHNIKVPLTFCGSQAVIKAEAAVAIKRLGSPFVCKEINADRSQKNLLLRTKKDVNDVLDAAEPADIFMLQRYIKNDGYIRALVLGSDTELVIHRSAVDNEDPRKQHLNTPAGAANATALHGKEVPAKVNQLASWAAKVMHRQVAGVDLIQEKQTGDWFVLEVNTAPQIRSGAFVDAKLDAFAKFIDFELDR